MKIAILGATRGMGRSLARLLAERGDSISVLGRDLANLEKTVSDLKARSKNNNAIFAVSCDLNQPATFASAIDQAETSLQGLDAVVLTAATFETEENLEADAALAERLLTTDFVNTILFCEAARKKLLSNGGGTLCVFSSVAGDRARKPVIIYGAAKAGLSHYLEGLDHKFRSAGLKTICVKPGFVKTGMTAGLKPPPFAGEPDAVAHLVVRAIDCGSPVIYAPSIWKWVMAVIKRLPRLVMRKIAF